MAEGKKSFIAYADWKQIFDELPNEQAGELIKHIFAYVNDENPMSDSILIRAVFANIKTTLKRDLEKWDRQLLQRSEAGKASVLSRLTKKNERSISLNETVRNSTDNVNVSVSVNDSVNVNVTDTVIKNDRELKKTETIEERKRAFASTLEPFKETFGRDLLNKFYAYWTEPSQKSKKLRFEYEKTWDTKRRLDTWLEKEKSFNKNQASGGAQPFSKVAHAVSENAKAKQSLMQKHEEEQEYFRQNGMDENGNRIS